MTIVQAIKRIRELQKDDPTIWGFHIYNDLRHEGASRSVAIKVLKLTGYACFKEYSEYHKRDMLTISMKPFPLIKRLIWQHYKISDDTAGTYWEEEYAIAS